MMSLSFFSQVQAMMTGEEQEKGVEEHQGRFIITLYMFNNFCSCSSSKSVKRRNRTEKKVNVEKSLIFASKRKSSLPLCDVDLATSPRGEKFRKSSPSSSLRNQDSLQFECKEIRDIP